jgi:RimJ/RimL family protein N-acetyltransferase
VEAVSLIEPRDFTLRDGTAVTLGSPTLDDAEAMVAYLDLVRRESENILWSLDDPLPSIERERAMVSEHAGNPGAVLLAARSGGRLIGFADVEAGRMARVRHRGGLGISTLRDWWGRGLGTIMMNELIAWSRRAGLEVLQLTVYAHNARAIALYRKVGFVEEGVRRRSVRYADGRYADEFLMSLWIGPGGPSGPGSPGSSVSGVPD